MEKKLKIVHISTYSYGGAGRAAYRIHEALLKNGVDSTFLSLDNTSFKKINDNLITTQKLYTPPFWERQKNRIKFRLTKHFKIEFNLIEKIILKYKLLYPELKCEAATLPFSLFNILENPIVKSADIIHLHWIANIVDYKSFFSTNNKPIVWTLHDMNPFQGLFHYREDQIINLNKASWLDKKIYSIKRKAISQNKTKLALVAPSQWLLEEGIQSRAFKQNSSICIAYPLDTSVFYSNLNSNFKLENNIPKNNIIILFVADNVNHRRKGFDLLINSLRNIKKFPVTLIVLGCSEELNVYDLDIRSLGRKNNDEELAYYYSNSDVFILPSREDNLPNVMIESFACGTPAIGFPVGGIKEHIIDFETGILAKEVNSESLTRAIETFCQKKELFIKENIRQYALKNFSENLIASKYSTVYNKVFSKNKINF